MTINISIIIIITKIVSKKKQQATRALQILL